LLDAATVACRARIVVDSVTSVGSTAALSSFLTSANRNFLEPRHRPS